MTDINASPTGSLSCRNVNRLVTARWQLACPGCVGAHLAIVLARSRSGVKPWASGIKHIDTSDFKARTSPITDPRGATPTPLIL